jgi:hypothetical protein
MIFAAWRPFNYFNEAKWMVHYPWKVAGLAIIVFLCGYFSNKNPWV